MPTNTPVNIKGNALASFNATSIFNGSDFFDLIGSIDVKAPRVSPMVMTLNYTKAAATISNVSTTFEGKGFVNFSTLTNPKTANIKIDANTITIDGEVEEKPGKTFETIPAQFIISNPATPSYSVVLPKNYELDLSSGDAGGYKLVLDNGFMNVVGNDWDLLTFSGQMASKQDKGAGIAKNHMTFKVYGDVQVSGDNITTTNTTPFGAFTMVYDFKKASLHGSLNIDDLEFGAARIKGTVEMQVDKTGFYFAGAGQAEVEGPFPVGGTYTVGFLLGDYSVTANSDLWQMVNEYMYEKNNCWPANNKEHLTGVFFAAGKRFLDVEKDFDFVLVSGYVKAIAGVDANIWANFGDGTNAGIKVTAYVDVEAALSACTGTSIKGALTIDGSVEGKYANSKLSFNATIDNTFSASISQYIPIIGTISKSVDVSALLRGGTDGFSFELSSGGDKAVKCN